jgi:uncharacterized protein (DUF58 family)
MTTQLREAIARLRKAPVTSMIQDRDILLICDALEARLKPAPAFDKVAYQREYMRRRRAEEKLLKLEVFAEEKLRLLGHRSKDFNEV